MAVTWSKLPLQTVNLARTVLFLRLFPLSRLPPCRTINHLHGDESERGQHDEHEQRESPADVHRVDTRHHDRRSTSAQQTPHQVESGHGGGALLGIHVDQESGHDALHRDGRPPEHEQTDDRNRHVHSLFDRPAKDHDGRALQPAIQPDESEPRALERKILRVAGERGLDAPVVVVEQFARQQRPADAAGAVGNEDQPRLDLAEAVVHREQGRQRRQHHLPDRVEDADEEDGEGNLEADEDPHRAQDIDLLPLGSRIRDLLYFWTVPVLAEISPSLDSREGGLGPRPLRRNGAIANDRPQRLRQHHNEHDEKDSAVNGQKPEDGAPSQRVGEGAAQNWPDSHGHQQAGLEEAHVAAAFFARGDVADDAGADGDGACTAGTLHAAQDHQLCVAALRLCESDAGAEEDDERADVRDPAPVDVGECAPERGRQTLEDHVRRDAEIDEFGRDMQIGCHLGDGGEVDVGCKAGEGRRDGDYQDEKGLLKAGVDREWDGRAGRRVMLLVFSHVGLFVC